MLRFGVLSTLFALLVCQPSLAQPTKTLHQTFVSPRSGSALSCQSCHAVSTVTAGGSAGFGSRRADPLWIAARIDQVDQSSFEALADPDDSDGDGISGRLNWALSLDRQGALPGRFGWKATAPTLEDQIANALTADMEIESGLIGFANASCAVEDRGCLVLTGKHALPIVQLLAEATRELNGTQEAPAMPEIFTQIGCATCHSPALQSKEGRAVHLFSDLLLHDLGEGLAENRSQGLAGPNEWRTAPLIGLSTRDRYLHDGRADSLDAAILLHGGEAKAAANEYQALQNEEKSLLLHFLKSL